MDSNGCGIQVGSYEFCRQIDSYRFRREIGAVGSYEFCRQVDSYRFRREINAAGSGRAA